MESFRWGPQFVTGIAEIDDQHLALVSMINNFGKVIAEDALTESVLLQTFKELAAYAQKHFDTEEKLMTDMQLDLRHIEDHLSRHSTFVLDITTLAETIDVEKPEDNHALFEYLIHWLAYHILGTDKNMARQIAAMKTGENATDAFHKEEKKASSATEPLLVALNGLFSLVSKRNKALIELNQTLDTRVAERTQELAEANKVLEKISDTDHLTQLPNRRFAMRQLNLHWAESIITKQPLACLMIDADGFKIINDTYGHDAGDIVLQRLAKELQDSTRNDDIACRLGGDEFFIICPNTTLDGALHLGEQIRKNVAALKIAAGDGFWLGSVSIGVACTNSKIKDVSALIKNADDAVYIAKRDGRNCVRSG